MHVFSRSLALGIALCATAFAEQSSLKSAGPQSVGAMAFGPNGVLFVGDSLGAAIVAIETGDTAKSSADPTHIKAVDAKIAALLGTAADQIQIHDAVVNPLSKRVYLSVSRGRGPDALPVILRTTAKGDLEEVALSTLKFSRAKLPDAPAESAVDQRGRPLRVESITDIEFVDGHVIVAGLSNEEFSSKLRSIKYPFASGDANLDKGASVEIYHGAHGRYETNSPVRTFVTYTIDKKPHLLAAYTCTPLVKFQLDELKPGSKVVGTTIAELGNMNRPLDMIVYRKGQEDFLLMNNSSRGVMKMTTKGIESFGPITERIAGTAGLPYQTLSDLKDVMQLDRWDQSNAMLLVRADGGMDIRSYALP